VPKHNLRKPLSHILMFVAFSVLLDGQARQSNGDSLRGGMPPSVPALAAGVSPESAPGSPTVVCEGNQLKISTNNSTLATVMADVQKCTGAKIEVPDGASASRVFSQYGLGPVREVLVALLNSAGYDYIIGSSKSDPDKVETVLLMARPVDTPALPLPNANAPARSAYLQTREDGGSASAPVDVILSHATAGPNTKIKAVAAAALVEQTATRADRTLVSNQASVSAAATRVARVSSSSTLPNARLKPVPSMETAGQTIVLTQALIKEGRWRDELAWFWKSTDTSGITTDRSEQGITYTANGDNVGTAHQEFAPYPVIIHPIQSFRSSAGALGPILVTAIDQRQIEIRQLATIRDGHSRLIGYIYFEPMKRDAGSYVAGESRLLRVSTKSPAGYPISWRELSEAIWQADRRFEIIVPGTLTIVILFLQMAARSLLNTWIVLLTVPLSAIGIIWSICLMHYGLSGAVWVSIIALFSFYTEAAIFRRFYLELTRRQATTQGPLQNAGRSAQSCSIERPHKAEQRVYNVLGQLKWLIFVNELHQRRLQSDEAN
jgi:hypothetical protein